MKDENEPNSVVIKSYIYIVRLFYIPVSDLAIIFRKIQIFKSKVFSCFSALFWVILQAFR